MRSSRRVTTSERLCHRLCCSSLLDLKLCLVLCRGSRKRHFWPTLGFWMSGGWEMGWIGPKAKRRVCLPIVFVVRLLFCWTQLKIRHYQHRDQPHGDCPGRTADGGSQPRLYGATRSRRPSKSVLYFRIAESRKAPSHMRYLAVGLFCWQLVLVFACNVATMGKAGKLQMYVVLPTREMLNLLWKAPVVDCFVLPGLR